MIISSANISMASARSYSSETNSGLVSVRGNEVNLSMSSSSRKENTLYFKDVLDSDIKNSSYDDMERSLLGMRSGSSKMSSSLNNVSRENSKRIREQSLLYLIRFLYNRLWKNKDEKIDPSTYLDSNNQGSQEANDSQIIGYNREYYSYEESEETTFSTSGTVKTDDGREISFNIDMILSRSFTEKYMSETEIRALNTANLVDPLVINLNNNVANVSDQKFYFDIDSDGILDSISYPDSDSGFLAIDLNEDGIINDGSELFGTKSGNGFIDLAKYDEDGNGFIDEADSVFNKLLIWTKDENGKDMLYHLKDKGVGAICLQSVPTNFSLKDLHDNTTNAVIRQSGVFIYENGQTGTIQQLDLAT